MAKSLVQWFPGPLVCWFSHFLVDCTVEPPNKGHVGTGSFVLYREVSYIRRLKCTGIIGIGTSKFVLYREVPFIRRLKCTGIIGTGTSRFVLYREVFFNQRLHCINGSVLAVGS